MKTTAKFIIVIFSIFLFWNCESDEMLTDENPSQITLKSTADFTYDFHISGDEEGVTIINQAKHYSISEIVRDETTNWSVVYHYQPESGYIGKDSVEFETNTGSNGTDNGKIEIVKFSFQITE